MDTGSDEDYTSSTSEGGSEYEKFLSNLEEIVSKDFKRYNQPVMCTVCKELRKKYPSFKSPVALVSHCATLFGNNLNLNIN